MQNHLWLLFSFAETKDFKIRSQYHELYRSMCVCVYVLVEWL